MTGPQRIRLSRARGFDLQAHSLALNGLPAIVVARPTRYGNPYVVKQSKGAPSLWDVWDWPVERMRTHSFESKREAAEHAVELYRVLVLVGERGRAVRDLRGKNVACWCPLDQPCHADVLLNFANEAA